VACINGDIMKIDFTGASEATVSRLPKNLKYKSKIIKVGRAKQMDPAVIAAIISRESRAGAALKDGLGDHGNGFGLMQVGQRNCFTLFEKIIVYKAPDKSDKLAHLSLMARVCSNKT
uniref:Uncharacterized protein n=1 Tax=Sinocyclocheilus grahami TaxID=75366 RepID=A0A672MRT2_SINGR